MGLWCCDQEPLDFVEIPMGSCESQALKSADSDGRTDQKVGRIRSVNVAHVARIHGYCEAGWL